MFNLATIAMFTFYFTANARGVQRAVLRLFSPRAQRRIGWTWDTAIEQTGGYFYSRVILMGINGVGFLLTMVIVGMPVSLALPLAVFAVLGSSRHLVVGADSATARSSARPWRGSPSPDRSDACSWPDCDACRRPSTSIAALTGNPDRGAAPSSQSL